MIKRPIVYIFFVLCCASVFSACDKWDSHNEVTDVALKQNLLQKIQADPALSKFSEYLVKTGYDTLLVSSKAYTVWAPDNQALQGLDPSIVNSTVKLKQVIGNHIVNLAYYTNMPNPVLRIKSLSGKYIRFTDKKFEDADLVKSNLYVNNGVLHTISKLVLPQLNIQEYISSTSFKQKTYMSSLDYQVVDSAKAEQTGVDPVTGKPVYKPGTGLVQKNKLSDRVGNLANEDQEYTVVLLTDAAIDAERNKFKPYTQGATPVETELLASLYVIKDFVFKGSYPLSNLPDTLVSADGVKVPMTKSAIVEMRTTSNGIVYVMNKADVKLKDKIMPVVREGEKPDGFSRTDKSEFVAYRLRKNPNTGALFNDIYISNHKIPLFNVRYRLHDIYSVKYKIYWVAPNDVQTVTFKQRLAINDPESMLFSETTVNLKNYSEVFIGDYTAAACGDLVAYIIAANNGVDQTNSINIDYFKLVPQLP